VVAEDDDVGVGVEFGVSAGGDVAHGHEERVGETCGLEFPRLADVEEDGGVGRGGGTEVEEGLRGDLGVEGDWLRGHDSRIPLGVRFRAGGPRRRQTTNVHPTG
jgi:hypothetical protein